MGGPGMRTGSGGMMGGRGMYAERGGMMGGGGMTGGPGMHMMEDGGGGAVPEGCRAPPSSPVLAAARAKRMDSLLGGVHVAGVIHGQLHVCCQCGLQTTAVVDGVEVRSPAHSKHTVSTQRKRTSTDRWTRRLHRGDRARRHTPAGGRYAGRRTY